MLDLEEFYCIVNKTFFRNHHKNSFVKVIELFFVQIRMFVKTSMFH